MKKFILLSVILVTTLALSAQTQTTTTTTTTTTPPLNGRGAVIQFPETSHDFGTIDEGTRASYEFEFSNSGDSNLILTDVRASCGCTVPTWPHQPIKPGEKAKITVVYNSTGHGGENFHKSITVTTNMRQDNVKILYIQGKVTPKAPVPNPQQTSPVKINQN
jgi:hypothetical protein